MAQGKEILKDMGAGEEEPEQLEALLEATQTEQEEKSESTPDEEDKRFLFSKKFWILAGGGTLLLVLSAVGAYFFLFSPKSESGETAPAPPPVETAKVPFNKVHVYALEPFFLPLKANDVETGNFISLILYFILSNSVLGEEIEEVLPAIRKNIYNILNRRNPKDYFLDKGRTKEQIKKAILTSANPLLLTGTGTINDVVFTQFVIK